MASTDLLKQSGLTRTDLDCHACNDRPGGGKFYAIINYDLNGDHEIECPRCGHIHYRTIKDGFVTQTRYSSDGRSRQIADASDRNLWKAETKPIATMSKASVLIRDIWSRDLWLRRED
jgi:phage FluMu protein Com